MDSLATHGALPVRETPFPCWPYFDEDEIAAVEGVLRSGRVNYWTGEQCGLFEKEFAARVGCRSAVAVMNGTAALEAALVALDIVTPRSYIASVSCVALRGAKPVFADVDRESQNITAASVAKVITSRTRAIIAVHLAGWPCAMDEIITLARLHNLAVIEDCAQATGALYKGRPVGSFGDVAAFSFCQDKIITTGGEGGMLTTGSEEIWMKAWSYKDHGKSYEAVCDNNDITPGPSFKWLHESFGKNLRMTEMQAALGRVQLRKMSAWIETRRRNADILTEAFSDISALRVTRPPENISHAYYKYYVFIRPDSLKADWNRERIIEAINAEGIPCFTGSCGEIYLEKAFDSNGLRPEKRLSVARELAETAMMFLVHPTLSEDDMRDTVEAVKKVLSVATL